MFFYSNGIYSQSFQVKVFGEFNKNASMVVISKSSNSNITALIESYLLMEGFDVRTESIVSSRKQELSNDINTKEGIEQKISISETNYISTTYIVEVNFSEKWDIIWKIKSLTVKISDLSNGKVVAVINKKSSAMRNPDTVAKNLVKELVNNIK